jgi:RNA polymerase sigma-70 factor, ECF subfamily
MFDFWGELIHSEPFALLPVYYCYRRRKWVTTCEAELIECAAHGAQEASRYLWETHHAAAMAAALRLCHQRALAEEITQGAFLLAWRGLSSFQKGSPFRPWLMRILFRHALDVIEKQRSYQRPISLDDAFELEVLLSSDSHMEQADLQENVAQREEMQQALAQLSAEQRRVVALRYGADLTEVDIAQVVALPTQLYWD